MKKNPFHPLLSVCRRILSPGGTGRWSAAAPTADHKRSRQICCPPRECAGRREARQETVAHLRSNRKVERVRVLMELHGDALKNTFTQQWGSAESKADGLHEWSWSRSATRKRVTVVEQTPGNLQLVKIFILLYFTVKLYEFTLRLFRFIFFFF